MSLSKSIIRQYRVVAAKDLPDIQGPEEAEKQSVGEGLANSLLEQAHAEAERILAEAQQQVKTIYQQAEAAGRQQGFEAGRAEGRAVAEAQAKQGAAHLQAVLNSVLEERVRILSGAESELVELALAVARKVIGDVATNNAEVISYMAHRAIEQLGQSGPFQIHLHPTDVQRLSAVWPKESKPDWKLVADERIAPGGCIVTCGAGQIDGRPDTQLDLIQRAFRSFQGDK
ncbi:MAG: hypothetical protein IT330_09700 [Anaerolineae bacterium]|nr:hypothetical protein [Anaerolineae bacterium]